MKSFTERNPKRIGAVVIAVVIAVVAGVLFLNRSVFVPSYTVHAQLANAAGLGKGAAVTVAGVKVGTVSGVTVQGNHVLADLALDHGVTLPHDTSAAVAVQTVLGVLDVALHPITGWNHPLAAGDTITDTSIPVEFQDIQNAAGTVLQQTDVNSFNQLVSALQQVTAGKQAQVATIVSGLSQFTTAVDSRQQQVGSLIDSANQLAATVAQHDTQLAGVVDDLATVVQGLASRSSDLSALIYQTDQVAAQTATLIGQNQPQLQGLLDHLQSVLAVLSQHQEDLAQGVSYLSAALEGFSSVGYSGPNNTPNTWANIYANLVGVAQGDSVLGNCAALDQALDQILGPDPTPCADRTGPVGGQTAAPSGGAPNDTSSPSANPADGGGTPSSPGSSSNPLQQILGSLLGTSAS